MSNDPNQPGYSKYRDKDYKGEKTPKHLAEGPINERICTDCLCCIIFVAFWVGAAYIGIFSVKTGNPNAFLYPYDTAQTQCGINGASGYKYLIWGYTSSNAITINQTFCSNICPTNTSNSSTFNSNNIYQDYSTSAGANINPYATVPIANRLCFPVSTNLSNYVSHNVVQDAWVTTMADLRDTYLPIIYVALIAVGVGFIYIFLMRFFVGPMTWFLLLAYLLGLVMIGILCNPNNFYNLTGINIQGAALKNTTSISDDWIEVISYVSFGVAGISFLLFICFFNKIRLAIAVLKCASLFIEQVPTILVIPPVFFILTLGFYAGWIWDTIFLLGTNTYTPYNGYPFPDTTWNDETQYFMWYNIFGLFWGSAFITALAQFIIASAVCIWYFKQANDDKDYGTPVLTSTWRALVLHCGSIAFGAACVAIVEFIRLILKYLENLMRSSRQASLENKALKYGCACAHCCLDCFERFLKFLNRHTYVQIAMTGENFCTACEQSFFLTARNWVRFGLVHGLGGFFVIIGQMFITGGATLCGWFILQSGTYMDDIFSPYPTLITFVIISFVIGHVFMSVYGVAADSIVHVYCMDEEIHDSWAKHAPPLLREFIDNHVQKKDALVNN